MVEPRFQPKSDRRPKIHLATNMLSGHFFRDTQYGAIWQLASFFFFYNMAHLFWLSLDLFITPLRQLVLLQKPKTLCQSELLVPVAQCGHQIPQAYCCFVWHLTQGSVLGEVKSVRPETTSLLCLFSIFTSGYSSSPPLKQRLFPPLYSTLSPFNFLSSFHRAT